MLSAGTEPKDEVHPLAVRAMAEIGVDVSDQRSKPLKEYLGRVSVRHLIIVCDGANDRCPSIWPGMQHRHYWPFDDPAGYAGSDDEVLPEFRRVRDEIKTRFEGWLPTV